MRIINTFSGEDVRIGDTFLDPCVLFGDPGRVNELMEQMDRALTEGRCTTERMGAQRHRGGPWEMRDTFSCVIGPSPEPQQLRLLEVDDHFLSARVLVGHPDGRQQWVPLIVRFAHPSFFLQRVGFIPT